MLAKIEISKKQERPEVKKQNLKIKPSSAKRQTSRGGPFLKTRPDSYFTPVNHT
jgi:hypothetical protein